MSEKELKRVFVGSDTYIEALDYYYVDKTLLIRDIINREAKVSLITRPRRFGKTLNMDMLKTFFEKTDDDTSEYFWDKKIWACGDDYRNEQGKYPVIFISFKDAKSKTWEQTYKDILEIISEEFLRHRELRNSEKLLPEDVEKYRRIASKTASDEEYRSSVKFLTRILNEHWNGGKKKKDKKVPIVLIDEYDTPIQAGYENGYYDQVIDFMRRLFSSGMKNNPDLYFAVLTGVLRISKQSLFSDLNNFKVYSVLDEKYSDDFGFTRDEVIDLLAYYGAEGKYNELCKWYDGYTFGSTEIFNPWSVLYYVIDGFIPSCPWVDTGENKLVGKLINNASTDVFGKINLLNEGEVITAKINNQVTYPELMSDSENVFTLLLYYGYLNSTGPDRSYVSMHEVAMSEKTSRTNNTNQYYKLSIPNTEISMVFKEQIVDRSFVNRNDFDTFWNVLECFDEKGIEDALHVLLDGVVNGRTSPVEDFYDGFVTCLCRYKGHQYNIEPECNSGEGKLDISLAPIDKSKPGIILELERVKDSSATINDTLKSRANAGLKQIIDKHYDTVLRNRGFANIVKIGIALCGSNARVSIAR